ncbi:MAG: Asp-tRNA(Asn)/Glu-tRNA(Gln) amidotransferase subunit GatA [Chloroflexi bacterium]|nr:Asp-tRNA(Asn)/Glu-tRNA(Gln) amidotransferase subunit GatA [Chloroflexota bacterium]
MPNERPSADLHYLTIRELAKAIASREVSPVEVTRATLERIDALDGLLNAFITVMADRALADARQAEQAILEGRYLGPLHGVPVSLKDLYQTAGVPTTGGSKILKDWVPTADSTVTQRLKRVGAIVVGKNNLHEFAFGATNENPHHGPSRNPWNSERITGGSSGGSAAAVAAGMSYASMGSDTGGSIRLPAALCGVVGIKPTYGLVSRAGVLPLSWSLDHCGPLTRTVEDAALVLNAIVGHDLADPSSCDRVVPDYTTALDGRVRGLRVGLLREYFGENVDPEVAEAVRTAASAIEGLGIPVEELSVPEVEYGIGASFAILYAEAAAIHEPWLTDRRGDYGPDVLQRLHQGERLSATQYLKGQRARRVLVRRFADVFSHVDLLLAPSTPILAPTFAESRGGRAREQLLGFTRLFNVLGQPALSVPCGFSTSGLPIGLQIVGRPFDELTVLRVAYAYQQRTDWLTHTPAL